jgi:hypothetical protein
VGVGHGLAPELNLIDAACGQASLYVRWLARRGTAVRTIGHARRAVADQLQGKRTMTNPRNYPDEIESAETGRTLRRGVKMMTINVDGHAFTYGQTGWWASLDGPADTDGQLTDEDNVIRAAAAPASARSKTPGPVPKGHRHAADVGSRRQPHPRNRAQELGRSNLRTNLQLPAGPGAGRPVTRLHDRPADAEGKKFCSFLKKRTKKLLHRAAATRPRLRLPKTARKSRT